MGIKGKYIGWYNVEGYHTEKTRAFDVYELEEEAYKPDGFIEQGFCGKYFCVESGGSQRFVRPSIRGLDHVATPEETHEKTFNLSTRKDYAEDTVL